MGRGFSSPSADLHLRQEHKQATRNMTLSPLQQGRGVPMQPIMIHYLFLDLDPLLSSVNAHVIAQPTVYPHELTQMGADGIMFNADRLTALLDNQEERQPPALVLCRYGSYFNCSQENARALQTVGWDLKKKGAIEHRTLEKLMERTLEQVGACNVLVAPKTLILATGELRPPTHSCLRAYLQSGWRVKIFCLQRCWNYALDDLIKTYQNHFTVVYLDPHLMDLLSGNTGSTNSTPTLKGPSLLSQMSNNTEMWNQMNVRRSNVKSAPHARALALLPTASEPHSTFSHSNNIAQFKRKEKETVERRHNWMAMLPKVYTPGNRQRYIFMNLDDVAGALFTSQTLYQLVDGATDFHDVRLNFRAFSKYLCMDDDRAAKCQVVTYSKMSQCLAHALLAFGWVLKPVTVAGDTDKELHYEMMSQLVANTTNTIKKTLVLAIGDSGLGYNSNKAVGYRKLICKFLEQGWFVEIHGWLHALNDGLLELQAQYPRRVIVKALDEHIGDLVYLKQKENGNAFSTFGEDSSPSISSTPLPSAPSIEAASFMDRTVSSSSFSPLESTVTSLKQQLQEMQDAFAALHTSVQTQQQLKEKNQKLEQSMREQAKDFEEERNRQAAMTAQQASDARFARRLQLKDREECLTCPITCEVYKDPMTTICCGKTFSAEVIEQVVGCCPWCRKDNFSTHRNRDVAELVEQYRAERDALDMEEFCGESGEEEDADDE